MFRHFYPASVLLPLVAVAALTSCKPGAGPDPVAVAPSPSLNAPAQPSHAPISFASRNGVAGLTDVLPQPDLQVRFGNNDFWQIGKIQTEGGTVVVTKPLAAPLSGVLQVYSPREILDQRAYTADPGAIDIPLDVAGLSTGLRVEGVETDFVVGNRAVRWPVGKACDLILAESREHIGSALVAEDGTVTVTGHLSGGQAVVKLATFAISLNMDNVGGALRLSPFEAKPRTGSRQVQVIPELQAVSLISSDTVISIDNIAISATGLISQAENLVAARKLELAPAFATLQIMTNGATFPWQLRRYETTSTAGSRSVNYLKADRIVVLSLASPSNLIGPFDPAGTEVPSALRRDGNQFTFNTLPVSLDFSALPVPFAVYPFEGDRQSGNRTITLVRGQAACAVHLDLFDNPIGRFSVDLDGTVKTDSPGLIVTGSTVRPKTLSVRATVGASNTPYQIHPFETASQVGSRLVAIVPGASGRVITASASIPYAIDANGGITSDSGAVTGANGFMTIRLP